MKTSQIIVLSILLFVTMSKAQEMNDAGEDEARVLDEDDQGDEFIPTKEWQPIKKGQGIPRGLHVRMNLETGVNEAKLLDEAAKPASTAMVATNNENVMEQQEKQVKIVEAIKHGDGLHIVDGDGPQSSAGAKLTPGQIQSALKNIKFGDVEVANNEDIARVKQKFRPIQELKEDLASLNLGLRSEAEEVAQLMQQFTKKDATNEEKLAALIDLEYLTHHVDAAQDFIQYNGIQLIIKPCFNASDISLQCAAAKLLGAASQGNPMVQAASLKEGMIGLFLRAAFGGCRILDESYEKCKASLYAISCLIRGFPAGQQNFMEVGGLTVFSVIFEKGDIDVKVKIVTLLHDLVLESHDAEQTHLISIEEILIENGWCDKIASLLFSPNYDRKARRDDLSAVAAPKLPIRSEHDILEKVLSCMAVLAPKCKDRFVSTLPILKELELSYGELSAREEVAPVDDKFYSSIHKQVQGILKVIQQVNDEL